MAETIITEFEIETNGFSAKIEEMVKATQRLDGSVDSAVTATSEFGSALGSASAKVKAHGAVMAAAKKETDAIAASSGKASTAMSGIAKAAASVDMSTVNAETKTLAATLMALGADGVKAFDQMSLASSEALDLLKVLIAEASKTPQGMEALARELTDVEQEALSAMQAMGALSAEEAEVVAQAVKLGAMSSDLSEEPRQAAEGYKSLKTQMREAKANLDALLESSDGKITPEIIAAAKHAGELDDRFGDLQATIKAFNPDEKFATFGAVINNVVGGFTAVQGAMALVGAESEDVQAGLLKVQAALAVSQGLQALFGGLKDNLKNVQLLLSASAASAGALGAAQRTVAAGTAAATVATGGFSGAMAVATTAARAMWAAITGPVGLVVAGIAAVGTAIYAIVQSNKEAEVSTDALLGSLKRLGDERERIASRRSDEGAFNRELQFVNEITALEKKRAAIPSHYSAERKELAALEIDAQVAAANRRKEAGERMALEAQATAASKAAAGDRERVEAQISALYKKSGQVYEASEGRRGAAAIEASKAMLSLTEQEARSAAARAKVNESLSKSQIEELDKLEEAREAYVKGEQDASAKANAARMAAALAAAKTEQEVTQEQARQQEVRRKNAEASRAKAAAAKEKADAEALMREEQLKAAQEKVGNVEAGADVTLSDSLATDAERQEAALKASFDRQIEEARKAYAELSALASADDLATIKQREAETVEKIEAAKVEKLKELREQDLANVRGYAMSAKEAEVAGINERFDAQVKEAERVVEEGTERTEILAGIERNRAAELSAIRAEADAAETERKAASNEVALGAMEGFAAASTALITGMAQGQEDAAAAFSKTMLNLAFDALNAMVPIWVAQATGASMAMPDSVATFGATGLARAAVITAIIKGALAGVRGAIQLRDGGYVSGPGTSRSDSIPARLSNGEYVLNAAAVRRMGVSTLDAINDGRAGRSMVRELALLSAASSHYSGGSTTVGVASFDDRRLVGAMGSIGSLEEQRRQTEILRELTRIRKDRARNPRSRW